MSLRLVFLTELVGLAKQGDPAALARKLREVMVGRDPATFDPDEHDPLQTAVLAWQQVAKRGRGTFEKVARVAVQSLEEARSTGTPEMADVDFAHAMVRLLHSLQPELVPGEVRKEVCRRLDGTVVGRQEFVTLFQPHHANASLFWCDIFRLALRWHGNELGWLDTVFKQSLADSKWQMEEGATLILLEAAMSSPVFLSLDILTSYWTEANLNRVIDHGDILKVFYGIGNALVLSGQGRAHLDSLFEPLRKRASQGLRIVGACPQDLFFRAAAEMYRGSDRRQQLLEALNGLDAPREIKESPYYHGKPVPSLIAALGIH